MHRRFVGAKSLFFAAALVVFAACDGSAPASESSAGASRTSGSADPGAPMRIDMDAIFPAGEGRDLVLNNCQSCHTWVPIVVLQMNEEEWNRWAVDHRARVSGLSDEEFATLHNYLVTNFNPDTPVPELPQALLESWTTY